MEKIKKILSPGNSKDDEIMYGSGNQGAGSTAQQAAGITEPLHSTPAANKEHGIARQILNPSGDKYDETRYGTTASTDPAHATGVPGTGEVAKRNLQSGLSSTDSTTTGQSSLPDRSLNQTAISSGEQGLSGSSSIDRKVPFLDHQHQGPHFGHEFHGPGQEPAGPHFTHGPHVTDTANRLDPHIPGEYPDASGVDVHSEHRFGRDAGLAGGAGAAGAGAYELEQSRNQPASGASLTSLEDQRAVPSSTHHHGRDAAIAGGVGAAGVGAYELGSDRTDRQSTTGSSSQGPASDTIGPHKSNLLNIVDPRVKPDLNKQKDTTTGSEDKHYGRDAAVVGGAGAAGVGAYELGSDRYDRQAGQGPNTTADTPYGAQAVTSEVPEKQHHYGRDATVAGGAGAAGVGAYELGKNRDQTTAASLQQDPLYEAAHRHAQQSIAPEPEQQHHYGRDAAVAGGGAGAVGVGAYELGKNRDQTTATSQQYGSTDPLQEAAHRHAQQSIAPEPEQQHHYGRDAALVGGGATAAGGAAYAIDHEKEAKLAKERAKEAEKAQHQHEKDLAHQQKAHEKEQKAHLHELEKRDKEAESHSKKEKSGGLFGFLHKNKDTEETSNVPDEPVDKVGGIGSHKSRAEHEAELGGVGDAGTTAAAYGEDRHHHNKLHKDPPLKVQQELEAKAALQEQEGIVYEPHTGLPMNVGKYGSGAGGTDAGPQHGYHEHSTGHSTGL